MSGPGPYFADGAVSLYLGDCRDPSPDTSTCLAEECCNWTGDGCICRVLDMDPNGSEGQGS